MLIRNAIKFALICALLWFKEAPGRAATLTNIRQVLDYNIASSTNLPTVEVEGVVTFAVRDGLWFYMQDQSAGGLVIATNVTPQTQPKNGQKVRVRGYPGEGLFAPYISRAKFEVIGTAPMPEPLRMPTIRFKQGAGFGQWAELEATVRDAFQEGDMLGLRVASGGEAVDLEIWPAPRNVAINAWPDQRIRFRGIVWTRADSQNRPVGFTFHVPGPQFMEKISPADSPDQRIKVTGQFLRKLDNSTYAFRTANGGLVAEPFVGFGRMDGRTTIPRAAREEFAPGDVVELYGSSPKNNYGQHLVDTDFHKIGPGTLPNPVVINLDSFDPVKLDGNLVTLEASVFSAASDVVVLNAKSGRFEAVLTQTNAEFAAMAPNYRVRVTGIGRASGGRPPRFEILVREPADLVVLGPPRFWEQAPTLQILKYFGAILALGVAWIWTLKQQVNASEQRNRELLGEKLKTADEKAQRSEATTRMISYFATSLLEKDTEEDIVWDLAKNCVAKLGFEDCVIYLLNKDRTALVQKAAYGPKCSEGREVQNALTIPLGIGIVGSVAQSGKPKLVADTRLDPLYIIDDKARLSELAVPIVSNGQTIGVIDSENSRTDFFKQEHLEALGAIASLCANKIVRVRAEVQLQKLNQELERRILERTAELSRANEQLRLSEERFSKAFVASPCLMSLTRMTDGRVIDANEAFLRVLNRTREQVIGQTTMELGLWGNSEERDQFLQALRTDGAIRYRERRYIIDGQEHVFLHSADVITLDNAPCLLTVAIDISDRKRAEAELLKALDRERELSQLKSNFVATVSHEFRTPLEIIMSSGEILDRYLDRLRPEQRHEHLQAIHDAVRRMSSLMEEVLVLGQVESGKVQLDKTPVDLVTFCLRLIEEIRAAADDRCPIELSTQDLPPMPALADESLLRHILMNLLSNAVKYSKPGAPVSLMIAHSEGHAIFQVADSGCGIPLEDQERVFNAFHRGQNVRKIRGTGLGLVIAKRCVELHNGRIRFQSEVGRGTTFQVRLPLFPNHNGNTSNNSHSTWFHRKEAGPIGI